MNLFSALIVAKCAPLFAYCGRRGTRENGRHLPPFPTSA
jgi:hypothetical protein